MRMRQLGQGQSVMFFAPLEIDQRIRKAAGKPESAVLETIDVLRWVMIETCDDITHHVPHWAQQGLDYFRRRDAWDAFTDSCDDHLLNPWIQPEGRSLVDLYGVNAGSATTNASLMSIPELRDRCRKIGVTFVSDSNMDEEQEREVSQEIEREQQIERPAKCKPATHTIHRHVRSFIETGTIRSNSTFVPYSVLSEASNRSVETRGPLGCYAPVISRRLSYVRILCPYVEGSKIPLRNS